MGNSCSLCLGFRKPLKPDSESDFQEISSGPGLSTPDSILSPRGLQGELEVEQAETRLTKFIFVCNDENNLEEFHDTMDNKRRRRRIIEKS